MAAPHVWTKHKKSLRVFPNAVNFIKFIAMNPCANPFALLVETFIPAFLMLFITISSMEWEDVAIDQLRTYPRYGPGRPASRGFRHMSRKGTASQPLHRKVLSGFAGPEKPYTKTLTTALYYITSPLEKLGFAMLLYGATDRFFYNWTSMLKQRRYCTADPAKGPFQRSKANDVVLFNIAESVVSLDTLIQNRAGWSNNPFGITLPGSQSYQVIFSGEYRSFADTLPGCMLLINRTWAGLFTATTRSDPVTLNKDSYTAMSVQTTINAELLTSVFVDWSTENPLAPIGPADARNQLVTIWAL